MILIKPRDGENTIRTEDIIANINEHGDSIAMILLPGKRNIFTYIAEIIYS